MNHTLWLQVCPCCCTAVCRSRQVPSLHCCPWWHDVTHCVENCRHCSCGGLLSWSMILQKIENGFLRYRRCTECFIQRCVLWVSDVCENSLSDPYLSPAAEHVKFHPASPKLRTSAGFMWNKSQLSPSWWTRSGRTLSTCSCMTSYALGVLHGLLLNSDKVTHESESSINPIAFFAFYSYVQILILFCKFSFL